MYKSHEIVGTDKPIFKAKPEGYFMLEEIVHLNLRTVDFEIGGYVQTFKSDQAFYIPVYKKRG